MTPSRMQVVRQSWVRFGEFLPDVRRRSHVVLVSGGFGLMAQLEERELAARDAGYAASRRHVPGFFVLRALPFWRFLLTGKPAARSDP